ncbi:AMP-binding protein [Desmospora profundinema]|uniref:Acyl-coenzyme A synthetase/AMP-(Fatty) acid ligase n=1 Tax=Desmospora profundinema TaxID=1571184 RepID=A0ABU1IP84_9BACL|nr:AMP-binding protein [Desmospora profundinema]MDR6226590.1 acyl-coenzyme A synthetase/AMP-(fatty) acid ligase [Desmospora profundinema]
MNVEHEKAWRSLADWLHNHVEKGPDGQTCVQVGNRVPDHLKIPWQLNWDQITHEQRKDWIDQLPDWFAFHTSGHTGKPKRWLRRKEQLLYETHMLAKLCRVAECDAIYTFSPVHHLYGFLFAVLMPVFKGIPIHYLTLGTPTSQWGKKPMIVTIPAALTELERNMESFRTCDQVMVVYSTARLPKTGRNLLDKEVDFSLLELLGSTETGYIAYRRLNCEKDGELWNLAPDMDLVKGGRGKIMLTVTGDRLAYDSAGNRLLTWNTGDIISVYDQNRFFLHGRENRIVKMNGKRINLDEIEERLKGFLPCSDLACVPLECEIRGEDYDLLVVRKHGYPLEVDEIRRKLNNILVSSEQPRQIHIKHEIRRTDTGKLCMGKVLE